MSEIEVPERGTEDVLCHCVLIHNVGTSSEEESLCNVTTSGPDDPFCFDCTDRHKGHIGVTTGHIKVEARLREKVQS